MNAKTELAASDDSAANSHNAPNPVPPPTNPHFALFVATAGGLGYFPKAPGTWSSLVGLVLALLPWWIFFGSTPGIIAAKHGNDSIFLKVSTWYSDPFLWVQIVLTFFIAGLGVWASDRVSQRFREKDPQYVVIDEVSGQHLTLLLGCGLPVWWKAVGPVFNTMPLGLITSR